MPPIGDECFHAVRRWEEKLSMVAPDKNAGRRRGGGIEVAPFVKRLLAGNAMGGTAWG